MTIPVVAVEKESLFSYGGEKIMLPSSLFRLKLLSLDQIIKTNNPIEDGAPLAVYIINDDPNFRKQIMEGSLVPSGELLLGSIVYNQPTCSDSVLAVFLDRESYQIWQDSQQIAYSQNPATGGFETSPTRPEAVPWTDTDVGEETPF